MTTSEWRPSNEAEQRMADAIARGDAVAYFQIVATAPLFVPTPADAQGERDAHQVVTITVDGHRHLLAFASLQAAAVGMGGEVDSVVATTYRELVENWPDPEWRLALDPGSPIGVLTEMATVMQTALDEPSVPGLDDDVPAEVTTSAIDVAIQADDSSLLLDTLVLATVFLPTARPSSSPQLAEPTFPWRSVPLGGMPTIMVFTSEERMAAGAGAGPHVRVSFAELLSAWPDPAYRLAVDVGWPTAMTFEGEQLPGLLSWFDDLMRPHPDDAE
jgi:SseB protein N-terminal domain